MKLNEVIELNGKEYTVELNRESILRIEQYTNFKNTSNEIKTTAIEDKSKKEILEDENPFGDEISEDKLEEDAENKQKTIKNVMAKAFWIWLYPVEKLSYKQVEDILEPYYENDEKAEELSQLYVDLSKKSVEIREKYLEERKNLKALAK